MILNISGVTGWMEVGRQHAWSQSPSFYYILFSEILIAFSPLIRPSLTLPVISPILQRTTDPTYLLNSTPAKRQTTNACI